MDRLTLCLAVGIGIVTTAAPARAQSDEDPWWGRDKALHFGVSAAIAAGSYGLSAPLLEEPWQRALVGGSVALVAGVGKELWDLAGNGTASWRDLTWDLIGIVAGLAFALSIDLAVRAARGDPEVASGEAALREPLVIRW